MEETGSERGRDLPRVTNKEALETLAGLTGSVHRLSARGLLAETTLSLFPAAPPAAISWRNVRGDSRCAHRPPHVALGRREELGLLGSLSRNQIVKG